MLPQPRSSPRRKEQKPPHTLLFEEYASHVHINDLNRSVHAFWRAVLDQPDELCERIGTARLDMREWRRQRAVQHATDPTELDLAFSTLYLNRTSHSGIIGGGPIGGYEQLGRWGIDARFPRQDLIRRIRRIARFKTRITVTGRDAADYLREDFVLFVDRPVFIYLDPPYYVKGVKRAGLYQNFYEHSDHLEIATLVANLDVPWIVSYDSAPEIARLYRTFKNVSYDLNYSANVPHYGSERMFFSPLIDPPAVVSAAHVPRHVVDQQRRAG